MSNEDMTRDQRIAQGRKHYATRADRRVKGDNRQNDAHKYDAFGGRMPGSETLRLRTQGREAFTALENWLKG